MDRVKHSAGQMDPVSIADTQRMSGCVWGAICMLQKHRHVASPNMAFRAALIRWKDCQVCPSSIFLLAWIYY